MTLRRKGVKAFALLFAACSLTPEYIGAKGEERERPRAGSSGTASTILAGPAGALGFTGELAA
ncbi:MAG: hypothetical protein JXA30_17585, partial [Deltaproteobacteria bacterium]|nr:hypothetical protein [Deltaproteobacteria bacterium]